MIERLKPRRARANAFGADRTDLDDVKATAPPTAASPMTPLGDLIPKTKQSKQRSASSAWDTSTRADDSEATAVAEVGEAVRPRGGGGRPPRTQAPTPQSDRVRAMSKRPARIPSSLYSRAEPLVKGTGRPSWGQLISWTCATKGEQVIAAVIEQLRPGDPLAPRGSNRVGGTTTTIIPQFLGEEIDPVETVHAQAQEAATREVGIPARNERVTATAVVVAALHVALTEVERPTSPSVDPGLVLDSRDRA